MAEKAVSREEVVDRIARVFKSEGYEAASLARLSSATGLGKASLYYHFPKGKEEMAMAVIERANRQFTAQIIEPLQKTSSPKARVAAMVRGLAGYYCDGEESCLLGVLAMSATPAAFQPFIQQGLATWIDTLALVLTDHGLPKRVAKQRAEDAVCRVEGALLLSRAFRDSGPFTRMLSQLPTQLLAPAAATKAVAAAP